MTNKKLKLKFRKGKKKMSLLQKLAYEFLPTSDENILSVDREIEKL